MLYNFDIIFSPKGVTGELVTPTGASLIRALCGLSSLFRSNNSEDSFSDIEDVEEMVLERVCKMDKVDFDIEIRRRVNCAIDSTSPPVFRR